MAYDKVVDSAVLDAGLKQIADAIREKGGTSDNLAFPSAMAGAIAAIEAGGGMKCVEGSVVLSADATASFRVDVDLSALLLPGESATKLHEKCNLLIWLSEIDCLATYDTGLKVAVWAVTNTSVFSRTVMLYGWDGSKSATATSGVAFDSRYFDIPFSSAAGRMGKSGYAYKYLVWRA